jgi:hypothetical protein
MTKLMEVGICFATANEDERKGARAGGRSGLAILARE